MRPSNIHLHSIYATIEIQYPGINVDALFDEIDIEISKKTQRIKSIYNIAAGEKTLFFSLRTNDGKFLPTMTGARKIVNTGYTGNRVTVSDLAAPFISSGKSAFCKHVIDASEDIFPGSDVFIFDPENVLLAVGIAMQPGYAMLQLASGIAVKTKKYK